MSERPAYVGGGDWTDLGGEGRDAVHGSADHPAQTPQQQQDSKHQTHGGCCNQNTPPATRSRSRGTPGLRAHVVPDLPEIPGKIGNNLTRPEKPPDVPEVHGGPRTVHVCVEVFELQKKRDVRREKKALSLQNKMREIVG